MEFNGLTPSLRLSFSARLSPPEMRKCALTFLLSYWIVSEQIMSKSNNENSFALYALSLFGHFPYFNISIKIENGTAF
jgi:hypothetical protein